MSLKPNQLKNIIQKSIGDINKKFRKELKLINLPKLILDLISKGISPVAGAVGRFKQYSKSYVDQITGKAAFFRKDGSLRVVEAISTKELTSLRASKEAKKQNKKNQEFIKKVTKERFGGKLRSPVNLKVTGEMHDSLTFNVNTGILEASDFKWDLHNRGQDNLPERRLLPDREGESFNRRVQQKITESLIKAIGIKGSKRFLSVKFNIKG
jgi:uncharacterized protein YeeX (DUF496 family)